MPSVVATLQALVVELRATIAEQRATIVRLEERVRDLETRVGQHSGNGNRSRGSVGDAQLVTGPATSGAA